MCLYFRSVLGIWAYSIDTSLNIFGLPVHYHLRNEHIPIIIKLRYQELRQRVSPKTNWSNVWTMYQKIMQVPIKLKYKQRVLTLLLNRTYFPGKTTSKGFHTIFIIKSKFASKLFQKVA